MMCVLLEFRMIVSCHINLPNLFVHDGGNSNGLEVIEIKATFTQILVTSKNYDTFDL